jgi:flagellar motor switch protein FliM
MADGLSQSEVDALLAAVGTSTGTSAEGARAAGGENVRAEFYDFLRPERVSSGDVRALVELHESTARSISSSLSASLGQPVQCRLQSVDQLSWGELILGLPNPTCFGVAQATHPISEGAGGGPDALGPLSLEIPYSVMFPAINRLLGSGTEQEARGSPSRSLTDIESHVAAGVMEIVLEAISGFWKRSTGVELVLTHVESNPQLVSVAPPTEMAMLVTFDVALGDGVAGLSHLCVPLGPLGPVVRRLAQAGSGYAASLARGGNVTARALGRVRVRLEASLPGPRMLLRDIVRLSAGQTIETGATSDDEVTISTAGRALFAGTAGESRAKRAVRITGARSGGASGRTR